MRRVTRMLFRQASTMKEPGERPCRPYEASCATATRLCDWPQPDVLLRYEVFGFLCFHVRWSLRVARVLSICLIETYDAIVFLRPLI